MVSRLASPRYTGRFTISIFIALLAFPAECSYNPSLRSKFSRASLSRLDSYDVLRFAMRALLFASTHEVTP